MLTQFIVPVVEENSLKLQSVKNGFTPLTETVRTLIDGKFYDLIENDLENGVVYLWDIQSGEVVTWNGSL